MKALEQLITPKAYENWKRLRDNPANVDVSNKILLSKMIEAIPETFAVFAHINYGNQSQAQVTGKDQVHNSLERFKQPARFSMADWKKHADAQVQDMFSDHPVGYAQWDKTMAFDYKP